MNHEPRFAVHSRRTIHRHLCALAILAALILLPGTIPRAVAAAAESPVTVSDSISPAANPVPTTTFDTATTTSLNTMLPTSEPPLRKPDATTIHRRKVIWSFAGVCAGLGGFGLLLWRLEVAYTRYKLRQRGIPTE